MNRRTFLSVLSSLPFLGWLKPLAAEATPESISLEEFIDNNPPRDPYFIFYYHHGSRTLRYETNRLETEVCWCSIRKDASFNGWFVGLRWVHPDTGVEWSDMPIALYVDGVQQKSLLSDLVEPRNNLISKSHLLPIPHVLISSNTP